jgi:hypothetical protein
MEETPEATPWRPDTTPEYPVSRSEQEWIEASMSWCRREFGTQVLHRGIARRADLLRSLPSPGEPEQIDALVSRVCPYRLTECHHSGGCFRTSPAKQARTHPKPESPETPGRN